MSDESLRRGLQDSAAGRTSDLGDFTQYAHRIEIDEAGDGEGPDYGYAAFCDCGWTSGWSHSDAMRSFRHGDPSSIDAARDEAYDEAERFGAAHLEDEEES